MEGNIALALAEAGFDVMTASDSADGVRIIYDTCPDMVLLDEKLSSVNDEQLCSYISRIFAIPIIALVSNEQGVLPAWFLEMGADACLANPLNQRMLLARISSVFRRYHAKRAYISDTSIELDSEQHQANLGGMIIDLTPTEFRLLNCLALNSGRVVPYLELAIGVWGKEGISPSGLKFYISSLRKKLATGGDSDFDLINQRGIGFRFTKQ